MLQLKKTLYLDLNSFIKNQDVHVILDGFVPKICHWHFSVNRPITVVFQLSDD